MIFEHIKIIYERDADKADQNDNGEGAKDLFNLFGCLRVVVRERHTGNKRKQQDDDHVKKKIKKTDLKSFYTL